MIYLKRLTMIQKLEKLKTKYLVLLVQLILLFLTQKLQIFKAKFLVLLITTNAVLNTEADEIKKTDTSHFINTHEFNRLTKTNKQTNKLLTIYKLQV